MKMTRTKTPGVNKTGMAGHEHAARMSEVPDRTRPSDDDETAVVQMRKDYAEASPELGTLPPLANGKQAHDGSPHMPALLDKLGERLAFERMGTRLYEGLMGKLESDGGFPGGPGREDLQRFHDEEAKHFRMLEQAIRRLGGDPTALTPSADLAALESEGVGKAVQDPRVKLPDALHALLVAELVDGDGWELLGRLAREARDDQLADACEEALEEEERHLEHVRGWVAAHSLKNGG